MIEYIKKLIKKLPDGGQNDSDGNGSDNDNGGTNDGGYLWVS